MYDAFGITVTSKTTQESRGWAWTVSSPLLGGDVPLLTVNENWYHFANVAVSEVKPGVKALDSGLVLRTTSSSGVNTSRTLPLADLTAYKVRRALEETLSLEQTVVVNRDVLKVPCSNFSTDTCRGYDYRVTFPASLGDVDVVRASLQGTSRSCRADASTKQVVNGTWADRGYLEPHGARWKYPRRHVGGYESFHEYQEGTASPTYETGAPSYETEAPTFETLAPSTPSQRPTTHYYTSSRETVDLPWNATAERVRQALVDIGIRASGVVREALDPHKGRVGYRWRLYYADAGRRALLSCGAQDGTFSTTETLRGTGKRCVVARNSKGIGPDVTVRVSHNGQDFVQPVPSLGEARQRDVPPVPTVFSVRLRVGLRESPLLERSSSMARL